ncbi:phosphatase PAP2 family protein [Thalassobacillus hwangdonensis]|uniref:Phosphatase PAP2 family protein n=1 Tax=Thalassobacillus hwangdonensis TaxID=546108 RepID=A0ABW3KZV0_9BACI
MFEAITYIGDTKMLALLSLIIVTVLLIRRRYSEVFFYLFLMAGGIIFTFVLKFLFKRERPGETIYIDFWGLGDGIISYAFPSGHAVKVFLMFAFLTYLVQRTMKSIKVKTALFSLFTLVTILVGIGQVMLDRHHTSDIIGGFGFAAVWFFFCLWLQKRFSQFRKTFTNNSEYNKMNVS